MIDRVTSELNCYEIAEANRPEPVSDKEIESRIADAVSFIKHNGEACLAEYKKSQDSDYLDDIASRYFELSLAGQFEAASELTNDIVKDLVFFAVDYLSDDEHTSKRAMQLYTKNMWEQNDED